VGRTISLKTAKGLFAGTSVLIFLLSVYISRYIFKEWAIISAAVYLASVLYDVYLKRSPLLGNITIAALASFIPLVIVWFAEDCIALLHNERIAVLIYLYALFPFLIIVARELSLDISDMEGDKALGCRTLPIVIGVKRSRIVVCFFLLLIVLFSFFMVYRYPYLAWVSLITDLLLLCYLYLFQKTSTRLEYIRIGRFLWFIMIFGLLGFALSTLYL
jgi:4-hydroxybenzoate polyprenyltransferase